MVTNKTHIACLLAILFSVNACPLFSIGKEEMRINGSEARISLKESKITTVFHEYKSIQNAGLVKVLLQRFSGENNNFEAEKDLYSFQYSERDMNGFLSQFKQLKKRLLDKVSSDRKAYRLTCYVIGSVLSKEMIPVLEEEWKEFPTAFIEPAQDHVDLGCLLIPSRQLNKPKLLFAIETEKASLRSMDGIKQRWIYSMAQELTKKRMEGVLREMQIHYDLRSEEGLLPSQFSLSVFSEIEDQFTVLTSLAHEVELLSQEGIDEEEFFHLQAKWTEWLENEIACHPSHDIEKVAALILEQNPFDQNTISYDQFLDASLAIVQDLSIQDLCAVFPDYLSGGRHSFKIFYPASYDIEEGRNFLPQSDFPSGPSLEQDSMSTETIMESLGAAGQSQNERDHAYFLGFKEASSQAFFPPPREEASPTDDLSAFYSLPITESEKKIIQKIVTTMAEKNVFQLLLEKKSLEKKGKKIRHIHPLRFMGYVLSDHHLRRCVKSFSKSYFKWSNFVEGFEDRMKEESKKGQLSPYIPGFAKELNTDQETVLRYINKGRYEDLIKHFL